MSKSIDPNSAFSTTDTTGTAPRSFEQIMEEYKKKQKQAHAETLNAVKDKITQVVNGVKNTATSVKNTVSKSLLNTSSKSLPQMETSGRDYINSDFNYVDNDDDLINSVLVSSGDDVNYGVTKSENDVSRNDDTKLDRNKLTKELDEQLAAGASETENVFGDKGYY